MSREKNFETVMRSALAMLPNPDAPGMLAIPYLGPAGEKLYLIVQRVELGIPEDDVPDRLAYYSEIAALNARTREALARACGDHMTDVTMAADLEGEDDDAAH